MKAVLIALRHFAPTLKGKVVLFLCDNSTTVWHLKKIGGVRVWQLNALAWLIFSKASKWGIRLQARHIPGDLNVIADRLSRKGQIQQSEWSLCPRVFALICRVLYKPMIDAFATKENAKLPLFISPIPDHNAYAIDGLSFPWDNLSLYAYPPTKILSEVLRKIATTTCQVLLIAPMWPTQVWFWDLLPLLVDPPRRLPHTPTLLKQPGHPPVFQHGPSAARWMDSACVAFTEPCLWFFISDQWRTSFDARRLIPPAYLRSRQTGVLQGQGGLLATGYLFMSSKILYLDPQ